MLPVYEKVLCSPGSSFACRRFRSRRFTAPWHFHPELELTWILSGKGRRFVGDRVERYGSGDLVLLGEDLPHFWCSDDSRSGFSESLVVQFGCSWLGDAFLQTPEGREAGKLFQRARRGLVITGTLREATVQRMKRMNETDGLERLAAFLEILGLLARGGDSLRTLCRQAYAPELKQEDRSRMARVMELINLRFREPLRENEVADCAAMTQSSFSRYFRRKTGKTFNLFLREVRLAEACRLLVEQEELPVIDVCYATGFSNLSNFNRQFRRACGTTPRAYRSRFREVGNGK